MIKKRLSEIIFPFLGGLSMNCPSCGSQVIVKNGWRENDKQNHKCLSCNRQFVEVPENKIISEKDRERIRKALLERVSLEGICRIFEVSIPWLLEFMKQVFENLPDHLNAVILEENEELEVGALEIDELHSFVGRKANDQWLWLVMHRKTRQILAFHVGKRDKQSALALLAKLPEDLKKKPSFTQINSMFTSKSYPLANIGHAANSLGRQVTLKDLIVP
jgi:transposase-like protein